MRKDAERFLRKTRIGGCTRQLLSDSGCALTQ
jgi:hypothetical protein